MSEVPVYSHAKKIKDIPFCLLFIVMILAQFVVLAFGIKDGNVTYLAKPTDSNNDLCGINNINGNDYTNQKYLYFINPQLLLNGTSLSACVDKCPDTLALDQANTICVHSVDKTSLNAFDWSQKQISGECTTIVYPTRTIVNRCVPLPGSVNANGVFDQSGVLNHGTSSAQIIFADVIASYPYIFAALGFSIVVAFFYLILLNYITAVMTWASIVLGQLILIAMSIYAGFECRDRFIGDGKIVDDQKKWETNIALAACVVFGVAALLYFLAFIVLMKRIKIAIEIIKEAADATKSMKSLFLYPLFTGILQLVVVGYFFIVAALLISTDKVQTSKTFNSDVYWYLNWYNLFGMLWGVSFVYGLHQTVIAGSIGQYYWSLNKKNIPKNPVFHAFMNAIKYSLGSIALGSLVLAIVRFLRFILGYLQRSAKQQHNAVLTKVLGCLNCCLGCIEGLVKFMNKNTYVIVGIYGHSFCTSAKTAFELLTRNALRLIAINTVSGFVIFIGKMFVSLLTTGLAYWGLRQLDTNNTIALTFPFVPAAIILVFTYVLAGVFFDVVDMAIGNQND